VRLDVHNCNRRSFVVDAFSREEKMPARADDARSRLLVTRRVAMPLQLPSRLLPCLPQIGFVVPTALIPGCPTAERSRGRSFIENSIAGNAAVGRF
jgi:hypothetical protein